MIKTVLFDVDGVLLSEERYFDASALTVWEVLSSEQYLGLSPNEFKTQYTDNEIDEIRAQVFVQDEVLSFLKSCGLNANWDMIYLTAAYQIIHLLKQIKATAKERITQWVTHEINRDVLLEMKEALAETKLTLNFGGFLKDFQGADATKAGLFAHLDKIAQEKLGVDYTVFGEQGELWSTCELISQEWYVGDQYVLQSTGRSSVQLGKKGFLTDEKVLAEPEAITDLFQSLKEAGVQIGIGTGRPELETIEPFQHLGWLNHFNPNKIVTADDVLAAEKVTENHKGLSKPHPFTYVWALSNKQKSIPECLATVFPIENGKETLIVGDSLADLLAARTMGCSFAAVLTGLSGEKAREQFEEYEADYILDNVLAVKDLVLSLVEK
ncbi:phosphoglycolate phosphatase-like HAD superfamily hydrolase [Lederbergia galactosidilyticus]|uniref:HAD family hydrolase n=1 Tax=Lederbergia galactosidilytica TaxID=217031 RepID=UPI001AE4B931|nr:HAD family hydrolase [Lederbergia galactosidilytica]MBP1916200.1 phosphoglycolate phosphatase-like HAD superfamily hydrolase [Lederbergia galactosidilytica]